MVNKVRIAGEIVSKPKFAYEAFGRNFFKFNIAPKRLSGNVDTIPVVVSENDIDLIIEGQYVEVEGEYRSYSENTSLKLVVHAKNVSKSFEGNNQNFISFTGVVKKNKGTRKTPFGKKITDIFILVERQVKDQYKRKSSYIPCILWDISEEKELIIEEGKKVFVVGRIQSREYVKRYEDGSEETKVAYEVSVSDIMALGQ